MHCTLLATVPHTGTRAIKEFFLNIPQGMKMLQDLEALSRNRTFLHGKDGDGLHPDGGNLVVGHLYPHCMATIQTLAQFWQPICTIKDPLATIITYHQRTTSEKELARTREGRSDPIFMAYMWTTFMWSFLPMRPHIIPMDLLTTEEERGDALDATLVASGLGLGEGMAAYVTKVAAEWPMVNSLGTSPLKEMYLQQDMVSIEKTIPQQVAILKSLEPDLRPILEEIGYKDLIWWT